MFTPSIYKLYSLSIIYKRRFDEVLAYFGVHLGDVGREQMSLALPNTHVIGDRSMDAMRLDLPKVPRDNSQLEKTNLVSTMFNQWGGLPVSLLPNTGPNTAVYGYVGSEDYTLFPLIRPGSFVQIDTAQNRIVRKNWSNEFDRPIYFVELRDSYICSWCELKETRLLLLPHPQSRSEVREVRFPHDAGVIGRVTAVSMRIAHTKSITEQE